MIDEKEKVLAGIEVHVTLKTEKKVFNSKKTFASENFEKNDLFNFSSWELGYLGEIPFLNNEVVEKAIKICSALSCKISKNLLFDRKIYSYFDLPKGFQITQEREPIGKNGFLPTFFSSSLTTIPVEKIQIEEDTAKSFYFEKEVLLDFRRSGNPLLEIVTKPVFDNVDSLLSFARQLKSLLIYLGISDAKMEDGQFRIDMNFSFEKGNYVSPRYEVKNLNSFRNLRNSFDQLLQQQRETYFSLKNNKLERVSYGSETLGYNESTQKIFFQREKSSYFYARESNIIPVVIEEKNIIDKSVPAFYLPWELLKEFSFGKKEELVENFLFINFLKLLREQNIQYFEYSKSFLIFFSSFLMPFFGKNRNLSQLENHQVRRVWILFSFSLDNKLSKDKVISSINSIFSSENYFPRKEDLLEKRREILSFQVVKEESWGIVSDDANKKKMKKILTDQERIFSFIFGLLKKKFPQTDFKHEEVKIVSEEIWNYFNIKKGLF